MLDTVIIPFVNTDFTLTVAGLVTLVLSVSKHSNESNFYFANFRIKIYIKKINCLSEIIFEIKTGK